jgi:four helix bundle protein
MRRIQDQLVGSSGGIGANLEEAPAASSRQEFIRFCEIALRESRETNFWLKVCQRIAAIVINTKNNDDD